MNKSKYFAADEAEVTVDYLQKKSAEWFRQIQLNNYLEKIKRSWMAYHGSFYEGSHSISYGGEQGELVNFPVNHYRNIGQHMLTMITSTRPSFQCRAINTDRKSLIQAKLGNGLLDYYMREKRLERFLKDATEYAISMGSGYVKMEWNANKGEISKFVEPDSSSIEYYDEENDMFYDSKGGEVKPIPLYEGDVEFSVLSPFDVVFDPTKENPEYHEWIICRSFINKYNLVQKYPEFSEDVLANSSKSELDGKRLSITPYDETDDIPVFEMFHERTITVPEGRHIIYLENGTILHDSKMIYKKIPVYRIAPSNILGTPFGYTGMFDLLPLQDAANSLYSTILTNQTAFGVQNIINPTGNNMKVNAMEGGLNFIEYTPMQNVPGGGKPEALQLTSTPPEIFNFLQMIVKDMETVSGINSVARGNPESSLKSGNALALIQSQALQFMSGLQQSYIQLLEDVGTGLINLLRDFATVPRIVAITGISNSTKMQEFKSDDIELINRVVVDVGNALMNSTAGRVEVAQNLLQMMPEKLTPEKYIEILYTGNLDSLTDGVYNEMDTIRNENEALIKEENVMAIATDHHASHIREHRDVLADPVLRQDAELVQRTLNHIMEHINLMQTTDPNLLAIIGEQALAPAGGSPIAGPQGGQGPPAGAPGAQDLVANPQAQSVAVPQGNLPEPAAPPAPFQNAPTKPEDLL